MEKRQLKTKEEAIQYAINWQNWVSTQNLSYSELIHWQEYWNTIAHQFDLVDEYKENGII
jgi:hypothetical protein